MLRLWCLGFFMGDKAEYTFVYESEQEAERDARKLEQDPDCWPIVVWEL